MEKKEQKTENGKNVEKIDSGQAFRAKNFGYSWCVLIPYEPITNLAFPISSGYFVRFGRSIDISGWDSVWKVFHQFMVPFCGLFMTKHWKICDLKIYAKKTRHEKLFIYAWAVGNHKRIPNIKMKWLGVWAHANASRTQWRMMIAKFEILATKHDTMM